MDNQVYACYLKNEEDLNKSSSGGAYTAISNAILEKGGTIIACGYDYKNHSLQFIAVNDIEGRNQTRGSKYIQADARDLYRLLEVQLRMGGSAPIMVVGTPCQISGTKLWLQNKKIISERKVIFCDLLCHGTSSPAMWKKYILSLEEKYHSKFCFITFKDKEKGWIRPTAKGTLINGDTVLLEDYAILYRSDDFMRESCYVCPFATTNRNTDITIGDFWNIGNVNPEFMNKQGTSMVIVHSEIGKEIFQDALKYLYTWESTIEDAMQHNMHTSTQKKKRFNAIRSDYRKKGLDYVIKKYVYYGSDNILIRRIRRKIMRMKYGE